jgi:hypothetical protein
MCRSDRVEVDIHHQPLGIGVGLDQHRLEPAGEDVAVAAVPAVEADRAELRAEVAADG